MSCLGENTVTDLIDALLAPERRATVEDHTAHCEACRRLISELVRRTQGRNSQLALGSPGSPVEREVAPGTRVGRYEVRELLGRGATGAVFAAFDPELDRLVALKLMHPALAQRERVQREARALARLAHPHVVAVYDAGALDGELFLAMELVDGTDLRSWMRGRPIRELVDAFVQAGRGLAAAHAAGLVHRDFKPDNVLIGRDGRVRIGDFGLAGGLDGATDLVGTPAYMAPEQLESGGSDAASDQFAFCVALYEALHGERPFVVNLTSEVARGPARWDKGLPRRIATALARGLELDPRRRFPGMAALVDALAPPRRSRRAIAIGAAAVVVASAATSAAIVASAGSTSTALCADSPVVFAATWNPIRAALVRTRFAATGAPFAEQAWSTVERAFAQFGARWAATRTEACEATRVHGVQSDLLLTLRTRCLDRALAEADELAGVLSTTTAASLVEATAAVDRLPQLDECSNATALLSPVPLPAGKDAAAVAEIDRELARGRAARDAARWPDALEIATRAVARTASLDHQPTRAAALFLLGEARAGTGTTAPAEASLRDAFAAAGAGRDDLLAARAAVELVFVVGELQQRFDDGLQWAFHAETSLARAGGDPDIAARLATYIGHIRYAQSQYPAARVQYERALHMRQQIDPENRATARALHSLGRTLAAQGDFAGGLARMTEALEVTERALGPRHPDLGVTLGAIAGVQLSFGRPADALASADRALAIAVPVLGPDHPRIGELEIMRGYALGELDRPTEALEAQHRAVAIFERDPGDQRRLALAVLGLGYVQHDLARYTEALATFRRALAILEQINGELDEIPSALDNIGETLLELGRLREGLASFHRALEARSRITAPDYFENANSYIGIADAKMRLGQPAAAIPPLRTALRLLAGHDGDPVVVASARLLLARAIHGAGGERAEVRTLIDLAEPALAEAGPAGVPYLEHLHALRRRL